MDITLVVPRMDAQSCGIRSLLGTVLPGATISVRIGAVPPGAVAEVSVDGGVPVPVLSRDAAGRTRYQPSLTLTISPEEFRARLVALSSAQRSETLTPREQQVLRLFEAGRDLGEIAEVLGISRATVQVHLAAIRERSAAPSPSRPVCTHRVARSA